MTSGSATRRAKQDHEAVERERAELAGRDRRLRAVRRTLGTLVALAAVTLVVLALLSARPQQSTDARSAPDFTLPTSDGSSVTLSDLRGAPVLLYFNEGAGCDACVVQMAAIEAEPGFRDSGITVLPIVMNTAEQINADRDRLGVASAFLLDDGSISAEYGTLGTGMHEGLPGHGFVLIDASGRQVWSGDYPSMWIDAGDLLGIALDQLWSTAPGGGEQTDWSHEHFSLPWSPCSRRGRRAGAGTHRGRLPGA